VKQVVDRAERAGQEADDSPWLDRGIRGGLVCYGVMHLLIAYLAVRLALGHGSGSASSQGAFHELAQGTAGVVTLWVVGAGFVVLVLWQLLEAAVGHRDEEGGKRAWKRLVSVGKAVLYGSLAASAFRTAVGSSGSGGGTKGVTAKVMQMPGGPVLVAAVGVGVLAVAGFLLYRGWSEGYRSKLDSRGQSGDDGRAYVLLGKVGYIGKSVAIAVVGGLFVYAAITHDPQKSGGLDVALREVLQQPFGTPLLLLLALGFACFGLFCFAWARHLDR
jgi:hypothetical protein